MENLDKYFGNTFKWHRSKLADLSDGNLHTEDGYVFPIHQLILSFKSQYFSALFCGTEKDKKEFLIPGVEGEVLNSILTYIYTGEIHVTTENICDLTIAADYLLLEDLVLQMNALLSKELSVANCLVIFTTALKINIGDIFKECLRFIEIHFEDIMRCKNNAFFELPLEALKQLLGDRNLRIRNENVIWEAIVEWVVSSPNRLPCVPDLLLCLEMDEVNDSLAKQILQHDIVAANPSCEKICDLKSTNPELNNLQILQHYLQNCPNTNASLFVRRSPPNLHFVADRYRKNGFFWTQIYVTYDEKLDLWRKVVEVDSKIGHILAINDCIYMFETLDGPIRYSITDKQWLEFRDFRNSLYRYKPVKLNGLIYILGGFSGITDGGFDVEIYDPRDNTWYDTAPMPPVYNFDAVTLNESIYVAGTRDDASRIVGMDEVIYDASRIVGMDEVIDDASRIVGMDEVIAEVYNPDTEIWNVLPPPTVHRSSCVLAAYHEKLYLFGGSELLVDDSYLPCKEVEVFDPANNIWSRAADLPYAYLSPEVVVINDQLIVCDMKINATNRSINPSVVWNVKDECWKTVEGFFSNTDFHMYKFFSLEDVEYVNFIAKENKDPETVFEKSPFF